MDTKLHSTTLKNKVRICENIVRISDSYKSWKNTVLKLQGSKCQYCGSTKRLHVHHIKPLAHIIYRFINIYDDALDINNTEQVLNIAENYMDLWDDGNGMVLCDSCHQLEHPTLIIEKEL